MPVDPGKLNLIAYAGDAFASPLLPETLDRVLDAADLRSGDRALELGCGHGQLATHYARRGLVVDAVERHAIVAEAARTRTSGLAVTVHAVDGAAFLDGAGGYALVSAVGAGGVAGFSAEPEQVLTPLAGAARPGGWVLWGESFWRVPPSPRLRAVTEITGRYGAHADNVAAGLSAGLTPVRATESSLAEWDDYLFRYVDAVETFAREQSADPDAPALLQRARAWRDLYLEEARAVMGFGLYLFRKP